MNDLISRQAAIDALDEQIRQCDKALSAFSISMKDEYAVKVERASLVAFRETLEYMPSARPERMTNRQWVDFLSAQFDISRTSAKEMLHGMMRWKKEDNFKKKCLMGERHESRPYQQTGGD